MSVHATCRNWKVGDPLTEMVCSDIEAVCHGLDGNACFAILCDVDHIAWNYHKYRRGKIPMDEFLAGAPDEVRAIFETLNTRGKW